MSVARPMGLLGRQRVQPSVLEWAPLDAVRRLRVEYSRNNTAGMRTVRASICIWGVFIVFGGAGGRPVDHHGGGPRWDDGMCEQLVPKLLSTLQIGWPRISARITLFANGTRQFSSDEPPLIHQQFHVEKWSLRTREDTNNVVKGHL